MDIVDVILGLVALGLTGALGFLYNKNKEKVTAALDLLEYMVEAGKDRQFTKEELQEIWRRINKLRGGAK